MTTLLLAFFVAAAVAPPLVGALGRRALAVLAAVPASATVWAILQTPKVLAGEYPRETLQWVSQINLTLTFRLDALGWLMTLLVGGIGTLVMIYSAWYFSTKATGLGKFAASLTGFAGAMFGLVTADNMLLMYVMWELTTVFSYLLIGHYAERQGSRRAAMQAIIITTAGGLAMLVGIVVLGETAGTYSLARILAEAGSLPALPAAAALIFAGAATKSALIPLHFWLPAAMAAPTPVSAYLHAAAMVKAGVYLVARFAPLFAHEPVWRWLVLILGLGTLLLGGYRALRQTDLKLLLAFGTVSQLGLIITLVGVGEQGLALAGLAMIGAHAVFKAGLFLSVGVVDAATETRDLRRLSGVGRALPVTAIGAGLCTASMIGLPPFAGFIAKEAAIDGLVTSGPADLVILVMVAIGSILTVAYGLRFWWGAFATKHTVALPVSDEHPLTPGQPEDAEPGAFAPPAPVNPVPIMMAGPVLVLGLLSLGLAVRPDLGEHILSLHSSTYPDGQAGHLVVWGGFTPALAISVVILALGLLMFIFRRAVGRFQARMPRVPEASSLYRSFMIRLDDFAADVTGVTQRGSLPFYLGFTFFVLALVTVPTLISYAAPSGMRWWDSPTQPVIAVLMAIAAVAAARSRRRLKAVVLAGVTGYGAAALFYLHGAPDVALTQVLVETVTLVVFVLVLRRLPVYFSDRPLALTRWLRLTVAVGVGLVVSVGALLVTGSRIHDPVSVSFPDGSYAYGGGKNIVNVTLVDIRAWDTMGEIAVLLVAATGVASMLFISRRDGRRNRIADLKSLEDQAVWAADAPMLALPLNVTRGVDSSRWAAANRPKTTPSPIGMSGGWLRAVRTLSPMRRSVILEVSTRLLFPTMIVVAAFLLFAGHNSPGGGFAAGLMVGLALTLRYLAGGRYELDEAMPIAPGVLLGVGLFLSAGNGLISMMAGGSVLQTWIWEFTVPVLGEVHLVTSLLFDVGVFLVVIGVVLDILRSQGAEIDRYIDRERQADNRRAVREHHEHQMGGSA